MFNATENGVFISNFYFSSGQYMCDALERLPAFGARTFLCYHNNNGSQTTVVETVEQT
jgi:hypothetical protein